MLVLGCFIERKLERERERDVENERIVFEEEEKPGPNPPLYFLFVFFIIFRITFAKPLRFFLIAELPLRFLKLQ